MSRVEHIRAAINYLDAVRYETGNDHPGYDRTVQLIDELHTLHGVFTVAAEQGHKP